MGRSAHRNLHSGSLETWMDLSDGSRVCGSRSEDGPARLAQRSSTAGQGAEFSDDCLRRSAVGWSSIIPMQPRGATWSVAFTSAVDHLAFAQCDRVQRWNGMIPPWVPICLSLLLFVLSLYREEIRRFLSVPPTKARNWWNSGIRWGFRRS